MSKHIIEVNQKEYAALIGKSPAWVTKELNKPGAKLPGVTKIKQFGRFKVLTVNKLRISATKLQK